MKKVYVKPSCEVEPFMIILMNIQDSWDDRPGYAKGTSFNEADDDSDEDETWKGTMNIWEE